MPSWQKIARRIRVPLGFVFAALFIWLAHPTWRSIILGSGIAVIGLLVRALASGHVRKNEQLTMTGPYAYTRNPLYLGSLILAFGFTVASRNWIIAAIAAAMLVIIYIPVIRAEEEFLRAHFAEFDDYCRNVPRLFPRLKLAQGSAGSFSAHLYWKHREYNAAVGAAAIIAVLVIKVLWFP
ncbi:MAG TPA: isoprenylcysteine carboxylmethyltransferase family protein [Terriglobales bacterium]|jgi:protein-S-isoprenylcysteine O-methyltransferase Ste14|nr:isoprenylcysteine carboxylmethyltransferase family protein [Terriglobales bacterium]